MKHKATIDPEFTNADLFEQEVLNAMRAYAKTISREAFQNEIKDRVTETTRRCFQRLYDTRYADADSTINQMVMGVIQAYIEKQMSSDAMLELMRSSLAQMKTEFRDEAMRRVQGEVKKYMSNAFVKNLINAEIKKAIPQAVVDALTKASAAAARGGEAPQEGRDS